jgi:hypothetical protein
VAEVEALVPAVRRTFLVDLAQVVAVEVSLHPTQRLLEGGEVEGAGVAALHLVGGHVLEVDWTEFRLMQESH